MRYFSDYSESDCLKKSAIQEYDKDVWLNVWEDIFASELRPEVASHCN